ncbi:AraC family transcriptional regulator [Arachnia propionica]|uniref:AraC family transcriptional regulator n=1 Tax=Arachnia propionica TaxID=1750 RepID=A0A3P1TBP5_9ACTN|nr:helix-turn-helix transcriptional regulator [Arachnia propionica]RRD06296.1 AraC family transcriptional regulator [Arachnia propionica]
MTTDPIIQDSRGILDPGRMREFVDFTRFDPPRPLEGIVQWFWAVTWDLPKGIEFTQPVLSHPCGNLSVGPRSTRGLDDDTVEATVVGVATRVDHRRLRGHGWNVAAKLEPGALGAFLEMDAAELTNRVVPMGQVLDLDAVGLTRDLEIMADNASRAARLGEILSTVLASRDAARLQAAHECARIAGRIARDRGIRGVTDLARCVAFHPRTLQRMFRQHAGVTPSWMIRRYRLIDAADAARSGNPPSWGELAAELGYADQAHLSREFSATIGMPPSRYAASVTVLTPSDPAASRR